MQEKTGSQSSQGSQSSYSTQNKFVQSLLGVLGRSWATPIDNLAKRSQVFSGSIGFKEIPILLFQNAKTPADKAKHAFSGFTLGLFYKGLQALTFNQTFELQTYLKGSFGAGPVTNLMSGIIASSLQTIFLHPVSTVRCRMQVNKDAMQAANGQINPRPAIKSSLFLSALQQRNFYDGAKANLGRNTVFFVGSSSVVDSYRQVIQGYRILGSGDKPNEIQENFARTLSGVTATFFAVFLDNHKTRAQVNGKIPGASNLIVEVVKDIQKNGFKTTGRASIFYAGAEFVGLLGFFGGIYAAKKLHKKFVEPDERASLGLKPG